MQRDFLPRDLDWVFCFGTSVGAVHERSRWASMNGREVPYQPHAHRADEGLRYVVRGRIRTCPLPPVGPRLDQQGMFSRLSCWIAGYVTSGTVVPVRDLAELEALRERASALVQEGRVHEWALAEMSAGGRAQWGLSLSAPEPLLEELAAHVDAPFRVRFGEGRVYTPTRAQVECVGSRGAGVVATHPVDALFDVAALPAFIDDWRARGAIAQAPNRTGPDDSPPSGGQSGRAVLLAFERPTGPNAWTRWVRED